MLNLIPPVGSAQKPTRTRVEGSGPTTAKIAIIGEAPGAEEMKVGEPFVGSAGNVLNACLLSAGLPRSTLYLTNVIKEHPRNNVITPYLGSKGWTPLGEPFVRQLGAELSKTDASVLVALGSTAFYALCGRRQILKYRGYPFSATLPGVEGRLVIPALHPAAALRGNYIYRYYIAHDLKKAGEAASGALHPSEPRIEIVKTLYDAKAWGIYFQSVPLVSFDIEVVNNEVACISFADPMVSVCFPIHESWTEQEEVQIWRHINSILTYPFSVKVGQNLIFDIWFLAVKAGVLVNDLCLNKDSVNDTMIAHHLLYPEMPKSLAFLGSLYGGLQPYWKDMVKFDNIKDES